MTSLVETSVKIVVHFGSIKSIINIYMDYTKITLGECLSSNNETVKRNAMSILKQLQKQDAICEHCNHEQNKNYSGCYCQKCGGLMIMRI